MSIENKFKTKLLSQAGLSHTDHKSRLAEYCRKAKIIAEVQGGIAVISDFVENRSYIYSGSFGECIGISSYIEIESAFEDIIFSLIDHKDLLDRHVLELRFIEFVKSIPSEKRNDFIQSSWLNLKLGGGNIPIIHQTRYLEVTTNGNINIGLCTYMPVGVCRNNDFEGEIINLTTGEIIGSGLLNRIGDNILSSREKEVLMLLSKGMSSKQIASELLISLNTVYRHRQNILSHLNVANTAEAVKIGLRMGII